MSIRLPISALLASLLLHAFFSAPFFLPGKSGFRTTDIAFLDLSAEVPPVTALPLTPPRTEVLASPKEEVKAPPEEMPRVVAKAPEIPAEERQVEEPPVPEQPAGEIASAQETHETLNPAGSGQPAPAQNDLALGLSRGFFQTLGNGRTLHPEVREYYMSMLERVNRRWWGEAVDHRSIRQEVLAVVIIAKNGLLLNGWIARSSGDPFLDQAVLNTIRAAAPFPPLPEEFATDYFQAPIRLVPPVAPDFMGE